MSSFIQNEKNLLLFEAVNAANIQQIKKLIKIGADLNAIFHCSSGAFYFSDSTLLGFIIDRAYYSFDSVDVSCFCSYKDCKYKTILLYPIGHKLLELVDCLIKFGAGTNGTIITRRHILDFYKKMSFEKRVCSFLKEESAQFSSYSTKFSRTQLCFDLFQTLLQTKTCDSETFYENDILYEICIFYMETKMSNQYEVLILSLIHSMLMFGYSLPSINVVNKVRRKYFQNKKKGLDLVEKKAEQMKKLFQFKNYTKNLYFGNMTFAKFVWFIYCLERKNVYLCF
jgi:hypothetical protein